MWKRERERIRSRGGRERKNKKQRWGVWEREGENKREEAGNDVKKWESRAALQVNHAWIEVRRDTT